MKHLSKLFICTCSFCFLVMFLAACRIIAQPTPDTTGVYIQLQRKDIYTIGFSTDTDSLGFVNADGTAIDSGKSILLVDNIAERAENNGGHLLYSISVYDASSNRIAEQPFLYSCGDGKVSITVSADGTIYGGKPTPEEVTPIPVPELRLEAFMLNESAGPEFSDEEYPLLIGSQTEYAARILIRANTDFRNPSLWALESSIDGNGELSIKEVRCLSNYYGAADLLKISADLGEFMPAAGISFIDANGILRHFYLSQSGMDGSVIIHEFFPA